eukprot:gnl/TRDRNA2_/TRDRNA2_145669_c1_seq1.p2 gnl/TRDRNA2_/TRDRNA2_145669_c1~~gnl/TRDRNA2_/TRDRNA2_145669_c1_seq1.p2  ORF type:complete len:119 (+),score=1.83 gnl/TRDRNA2_/TRDRNA2_145669_c1_seq1:68-424(+)
MISDLSCTFQLYSRAATFRYRSPVLFTHAHTRTHTIQRSGFRPELPWPRLDWSTISSMDATGKPPSVNVAVERVEVACSRIEIVAHLQEILTGLQPCFRFLVSQDCFPIGVVVLPPFV